MAPAAVTVRNVAKTFRSKGSVVAALDDLSLDVMPGELVVLLGPSGCGKTTLLRSIAGLETPDTGEIRIGDDTVFSGAQRIFALPEARSVSMVFQSYALWPHLSVFGNVAYPLQTRGTPKGEIADRVLAALRTVGCGHLPERYPHQLSGGQQQRVALARAIVAHQGVILFDEPLSNVDAKVRERLRIELIALQRQLGFAAVYVTHDQTEAMIVASRIAVMDRGRIVQIGTPAEIYEQPVSHYVADFIGAANFVPGTVRGADGDDLTIESAIGPARATGSGFKPGDDVELFFRPEHCRLASGPGEGANNWPCAVEASLYLGPNREHVLTAAGRRLLAWTTHSVNLPDPQRAVLQVEPKHIRVLPPGPQGGEGT